MCSLLVRPEPKPPAETPAQLRRLLPKMGVRERSNASLGHWDCHDGPNSLAHPSDGLVAQLNAAWRVVADPLQWVLQRKKGNPRSKNSGWRNRSYCTSRDGLLCRVREYCGDVSPDALAKLRGLPEHHAMQNLDVPGTYQAHVISHSDPLDREGLGTCEGRTSPPVGCAARSLLVSTPGKHRGHHQTPAHSVQPPRRS